MEGRLGGSGSGLAHDRRSSPIRIRGPKVFKLWAEMTSL